MVNTEFVCFISACGGSGCTSASRALGGILLKLFKKRVIVISLDRLGSKLSPASALKDHGSFIPSGLRCGPGDKFTFALETCRDDLGVTYIYSGDFLSPLHDIGRKELMSMLEAISLSESFDIVILDIPYQLKGSELLALCCEKVVLVTGYLDAQKKHADAFRRYMEGLAERMKDRPEIFLFDPSEDTESFADGEVDIHDQFGAEVRILADELYGDF